MTIPAQDLFDDSSMSFGDHLEVLRSHLWRAIIGIVICVIFTLFKGSAIISIMRQPIDDALHKYAIKSGTPIKLTEDVAENVDLWDRITKWFRTEWGFDDQPAPEGTETGAITAPAMEDEDITQKSAVIQVQIPISELARALHEVDPVQFPAPPAVVENDAPTAAGENEPQTDDSATPTRPPRPKMITLPLRSPVFSQLKSAADRIDKPVALNVQEAFMTYLKVSMISGLVLSSPWVFYQIWQFVAAGLYKHERKFVYIYGLMSLILFGVGVVFCFKLVFPYVLEFLLGYNADMQIQPQIRLSEWVSFAVTLPLMFGISFQLPLVMRFLQAVSIFTADSYREKRRMAILVIAFLSMVLTPADPMSMVLMMFPLLVLYEFGILLCHYSPSSNPFDSAPV
ncbi:MAG: twin-arginine translocase subunit TatC [Planctomycetaceae bacterium]